MTNGNVLGTSAINNTAGLTVLSVSDGVLASNYNYVLPSTIANVDITPAPLVYTGANNTTVFNNTLQTNSGARLTSGTLFGSDTFAISGYATKTDVSRVGNIASGALSASPDALIATATGATNPNNYLITFPGGLQLPSMPTPEVASSCNGLGKITVTNLIGAGPFDIYLNSTGDSAVNKVSGFTFQNVPIGSHNILVKDNNGCEFKFDGIYVRNKAPEIVFAEGCSAGYDAIIFVGESAYINGVSPGILKWEPRSFLKYLSDTTIENPTASPPAGIYNYILHSTDYSNCKECIDTVQIIVLPELSIPNTFTPNGDSYNDVWEIGDITRFQDNCEVWIYNRWGERVFHQTGYRNGEEWDGTNNGMALPPATYYYVIDVKAKDSAGKVKKYAGSITIIK
jgi:gliding motility-associated-like protein